MQRNEANIPTPDELVALGKITRTQGNAGAVRLLPFFSPVTRIEELKTPDVFVAPAAQEATGISGSARRLTIESVYYHKQFAILTFHEVPDMTSAEQLRDFILYAEPRNLWELEEAQFFAYELVGMKLVSVGDDRVDIGRVVAVEDGLAHDYLRVAGAKREFLVPFVRAIVRRIDTVERLIEVDIPPGLTDL
ncbi:MAG: ribosome maturation factor RimM [Candidatus Sumerlaeaceae bacterium]|nr:ribosome maturation factor RimM [Candidatus Sumerlaeaceae bacterium]